MDTKAENKAGISEKISTYKGDVEILCKYLPWLVQSKGTKVSKNVSPSENDEHALKVPVYDSTLLAFIKTAQKTKFMNRNYVYTYSKYKLKTPEDELKLIDKIQIMDIQVLGDILSRYVMKGMQRGAVWTEGVEKGVFLKTVEKMRELIEFWSVPI